MYIHSHVCITNLKFIPNHESDIARDLLCTLRTPPGSMFYIGHGCWLGFVYDKVRVKERAKKNADLISAHSSGREITG